jgi:hypothetical protein
MAGYILPLIASILALYWRFPVRQLGSAIDFRVLR